MNAIHVVADYGDLCGEGPIWDGMNQTLYWTDITGRRFFRFIWKEKRHEILHEGFEIAGFALSEGGAFVVTNSSGIWLLDGASVCRLLLNEVDGKKCVLNDCLADPEGRLFTGRTSMIQLTMTMDVGVSFGLTERVGIGRRRRDSSLQWAGPLA